MPLPLTFADLYRRHILPIVATICLLLFRDAQGCAQQYKRELRYLDFYLGIAPANDDGAITVDESRLHKYVGKGSDLECDFKTPCLWDNSPSDGLLDTSDFYLFEKSDEKTFPIQIRPGNANPAPGHLFMLSGNTTDEAQSAVLVSAPMACLTSSAHLSFEYWLYNVARLEVLMLRVNPSRGHLQVIRRPTAECNFLRPSEDICRVEIPQTDEPFKLGIRAFGLRDPSVGSFAMISKIKFVGEICKPREKPVLFGGVPLTKTLPQRPIVKAVELHCAEHMLDCPWAVASRSLSTDSQDGWFIGSHVRQWPDIVRIPLHPEGEFFFQRIDPMAELPLPQLRSVLVPCTRGPSSLTFRFWLSPGIQAQLCTLSADNVALSCIYLNEADVPGPLMIDVDTADNQPFRFAFEAIKFDRSSGGLIAIDDIVYTGVLCTEQPPTTTTNPRSIATLFDLQAFPSFSGAGYSESLECDFETDFCSHWMNDEQETHFQYGSVPKGTPYGLDDRLLGNAAVAVFSRANQFATLTSQLIACAEDGRLSVTYYSSDGAMMSICADDRCVQQRKPFGELSVNLSSTQPFRLRVVGESQKESFVIVKKISSSDGFCRLQSPTELACKALSCEFKDGTLCDYRSVLVGSEDTPFQYLAGEGVTATLSAGMRRAILRSPAFQLSSSAELRFEASLSTFGARLYICPDVETANALENCELVLGPKVERKKLERILVQLDTDIRQFVFVAVHDKFLQFGDAEVLLSRVQLTDSNGNLIC